MLERIDRYILKEAIGSGGQATVYLADDPDLDRIVAVKVLNQLVSSQRNFIDLFAGFVKNSLLKTIS